MSVIGFSFNKFDCIRNKVNATGSIEINHQVSITNVEKSALSVGGAKNEVLKVEFQFDVKYGNDLGHISLHGDVIYTDTPEIINETFKGWESEKKLNSTVNEQVQKFVYNKGVVKALELSDNLNLPSPIPLMPKNMFSKKQQ